MHRPRTPACVTKRARAYGEAAMGGQRTDLGDRLQQLLHGGAGGGRERGKRGLEVRDGGLDGRGRERGRRARAARRRGAATARAAAEDGRGDGARGGSSSSGGGEG